jgi:tetratricopeptide (TPR) repeat protein
LPRDSFIPVLAVKRSYILWRRARIALIAASAVAAILTGALVVKSRLVRKEVRETVSRALAEESAGGLGEIRSARGTLAELAERRSDESAALQASAWLHVLEALLFGPDELAKKAELALSASGVDRDSLGASAEAGLALLRGKYDEAQRLAENGLTKHPGEPRLALVRAMALDAKGDFAAASRAFLDAAMASPLYFPLAAAGLEAAVRADDAESGRRFAALLARSSSKDRLLGSLAAAAFSLGRWGEEKKGGETAEILLSMMDELEAEIGAAPPRLGGLGRYIEGRVLLDADRPADAANAFELAMERLPAPNAVAWCGLALLESKGPDAALALLDTHPGVTSAPVLDLRARCLLANDRVDKAAKVLDALETTGALPARVAGLRFALAVKRGDSEDALSRLPETIDPKRAETALELFFQLEDDGAKKGVVKLTKALDGELAGCGKVMRTWHTQDPAPALRKMNAEESDPCVSALAVKLLWGRTDLSSLRRSLERVTPEMRANLSFRVLEARAAWLTEGRDTALAILDAVMAKKPEAVPLALEVARAYAEMGKPERAVEALRGVETPKALAILYGAAREKKDAGAVDIVETATRKHAEAPHPALAVIIAHAQFTAGDPKDAAKTADKILPNAGRFTAQLAEIAAKSINLYGDRADADRLLLGTARRIGASFGLEELWDLELAYVRMNISRGGSKFQRRAEAMLGDMKRDGAVDARIPLEEGMLAARSGDKEKAAFNFRKALALNPSIGAAYAQLKKLAALDAETAATMRKVLPDFEP